MDGEVPVPWPEIDPNVDCALTDAELFRQRYIPDKGGLGGIKDLWQDAP